MDVSLESLISFPWLTQLILFLLLPLLFFLLSQKWKKSAANLPPGPPTLPIIGNFHQIGKCPHQSFWKLSQKYGPIMLLKLGEIPTLIISSPEMAKQVTKDHDANCCSRPSSYGMRKLSYNFSDVSFCPYSEYWRQMRKLFFVELFTVKRVQSYSTLRQAEMSKLINSICHADGTTVNLSERVSHLTDTLISQIAFGKIYDGKQFEGKFHEFIEECTTMLSCFWASDFFPAFGWCIDYCLGRQRRLDKCFNNLDGFYERIIEEHIKSDRRISEHEEDIVDILLGLSMDETGPVHLSRDNIKGLLMDIFLAGIDTNLVAIIWAMSEIVKEPRVMNKVQAEIRSVVGRKPNVSESDIEKLLYLKMVVKEALRLHPPLPLIIPHETMSHCVIGGYDVYPKTRILISAWAIGRDPNVWQNPEEFYPERFEDNMIDYKGGNYELLPFGSGRRMCPGITMASITVEFTLANLLHCFDWKMPIGMKKEDMSLEEGDAGLTVHKKIPLELVPLKYNWEEYQG